MGHIPVGEVFWYPPLYHVWLSTFISFTGAASIEQAIFMLKCVTVLVDWLLIFSVYLLAGRFFGKKSGVFAAAFMMIILPFYDLNFWGAYTSIASIALLVMLMFYLSSNKKDPAATLLIFMLTFSMVLTHQLTTFLAVLILGPVVLASFFRSRGRFSKVYLAVILGGALAFLLYYSPTILPHLGDIITYHLATEVRSMTYQIPLVSPQSIYLSYGFLIVLAALGMVAAFYKARKIKNLTVFALIALGFFVPFLLSQTYLIGLFLPFERFLNYIVPFTAIFAGIACAFIFEWYFSTYQKHPNRKRLIQTLTVILIVLVAAVAVTRFETVGVRIHDGIYYYSLTDNTAYDAAVWLREHYPGTSTVVVSEKPGEWFGLYSGKMIIAAQDPIVQRNLAAECVLDLADEVETPITLLRVYDARGSISDELQINVDGVWQRMFVFDKTGTSIYFNQNGQSYHYSLSELTRQFTLDTQNNTAQINTTYSNQQIAITQKIQVSNDKYPINYDWSITPLQDQITNVTFRMTLSLSFDGTKAYVPGVLNWESPWKYAQNTTKVAWTVVNFTSADVSDNFFGVFDEKNQAAFALKLGQLPSWGNIGAVATGWVDNLRLEFPVADIALGQNQSLTYQIETFTKTSYPDMPPLDQMKTVFDVQASYTIYSRSFMDYIKDQNIGFIVYDKPSFYPQLTESNILNVVYENNNYVICKIKTLP
ncbi:MAG: hypothetical protein NWF01_01505 [Candidatus Bathyarchaeota archaeon]|nr:hypothetical protein [Candidatus Bathyarchaeota archaeon]